MSNISLPPEDAATKRQLPKLLDARRRLTGGNDFFSMHGPEIDERSASAGKSGALRAAVFGMNDGLLSNAALIMGFAGAAASRQVIVLAGISGLLAGAFSMGAGEYVSMRVQREMLERLLQLERRELELDPVTEERELAMIYRQKGLSGELSDRVAAEVMKDPAVALDTHAREELGLDPEGGLGSPWGAAISSFAMFAIGALIPLIPFFLTQGRAATIWALSLTGLALLTTGALTARLTGKGPVMAALRQLGIGAAATAVTFFIGRLLGVAVS
jgi:VIT1/CCC1 family predicted Fe2+/Mn2+ transporter